MRRNAFRRAEFDGFPTYGPDSRLVCRSFPPAEPRRAEIPLISDRVFASDTPSSIIVSCRPANYGWLKLTHRASKIADAPA